MGLELISKAIEIDNKCDFAYETMGTIEVQRFVKAKIYFLGPYNLCNVKNAVGIKESRHKNLYLLYKANWRDICQFKCISPQYSTDKIPNVQ